MRIFLNSYHPLCETRKGQEIIREFGLPPFIDASIRREPDFECEYPSVSGLCRLDKLVGRANVGDLIAYVTVKRGGARRLVAILEVVQKFVSHADAAAWYMQKIGRLPSNCMVPGNPPMPLTKAVNNKRCRSHGAWDAEYQARAERCGTFLACRAEVLELHNPPVVPETIFGARFPNTQSPCNLEEANLDRLRRLVLTPEQRSQP